MKCVVLSIFFLLSSPVWAHPVAFKGATSFMSLNNSQMTENTLVYSPEYWLGTGVKHITNGDDEWTNAHLGLLLKRWNEFESQGNFYLFGGPGRLKTKSESEYFTKVGAQLDWESRRLYSYARYSGAYSKVKDLEQYEGRVGFAPYIAGFNDLNSWLMLQVQHVPERKDETMVTPMIRMFYKNVLWELGSSLKSDWMLNFMVRY